MTYHGGVEDGKSSLAAQILRIINVNVTISAQDRLDQIEKLCLALKKEPIRERHTGFSLDEVEARNDNYG